jgi:predicted small metal-binding protein
MTRPITCKESERDCIWSFNDENMEEVWSKLKEHILSQHKEIELNSENIEILKSIITSKVYKDGVRIESGRFWWWGEKMDKVNRLIADQQ